MKDFGRDEGGQAILLVAVTMLAMLFAVGLAMDIGQLYNGRRTAQEAADAAAFAGAVVVYQQGTSSQATTAATSDASLNGYATDTPTSGTTITVNIPPTSGSYSGNSSCVQVVIATPVLTSLVPQQSAFTTVTARGTACSVAASSTYAMMATDQACTKDALSVSSNGTLTIHQGSIQVNSCDSKAAENNDTAVGAISMDSGYETDVVGGTTGTWPNPYTGKSVQADPFAGTPKPSTIGLTTYTSFVCYNSGGTGGCTSDTASAVNQPGVYSGASASKNGTYIFAPGTYILVNSGFSLGGSAGTCTGSRVDTTSTTAVSAGSRTVTPANMTNIVAGKMLILDAGTSAQEAISVSSVTATTFTATFLSSHSGTWNVQASVADSTSPAYCPVPTADGGVFFFIASANYPSTGGGCQSNTVAINGGGASTLYPPTSGTYQGMLIWQDTSCTQTLSFGGNGAITTTGSIYAPNATVSGNGTGSVVRLSQVVAKDINVQNAAFTVSYDQDFTYRGLIPALVE